MNEDMEFINFAENFFGQLPSEKNREYEKQLTKFTEQYSSQKHLGAYNRMIEEDHPNAYEAFFCLCTVYRHNRDYAKLHALLQSCNRFKKHLSYNHILAMYQVHSESFYDYDELLAMTCRDAEMMENNSGYLHTFANAFATICEKCGENNCDTIIGEWYEPAVNNGELVPSARSNCTTLPKQEYRLAGWLYRSATALCQRCEPLFR